MTQAARAPAAEPRMDTAPRPFGALHVPGDTGHPAVRVQFVLLAVGSGFGRPDGSQSHISRAARTRTAAAVRKTRA
ncbi:hypothetical protein GCM10023257_60780 [Streptomyces hyderabadensis]|uniref:Uncharacterized protein n=1 Tax=Streptomyces hyderabadensis TaxID=598549 RepID=A0ABP9IQW2_9ACTN